METEVAVFVQADRVKCFYAVQGDSFEVECLAVGFGNPSVDFKLFFLVFTSRSQYHEGGHGACHFFHLGIMCLQTIYKDRVFRLLSEYETTVFSEKSHVVPFFTGFKSDLSIFMRTFARFIDETF